MQQVTKPSVLGLVLLISTVAGGFLLLGIDATSHRAPRLTHPGADGRTNDGTRGPAFLQRLQALGYAKWIPDLGNRREGVTQHATAAYPGVNLYTSRPRASAHLIDMDGTVLHTWALERVPGGWQHVELGPAGTLFAIREERELTKLDWHSNVVWSRPLRVHHDVALAADGRIATLERELRLIDVRGRRLPVLDDYIVILDSDGATLDRISVHDLFADAVPDAHWLAIEEKIASGSGRRLLWDGSPSDVYHTNSVRFVRWGSKQPRDALLISIRQLGELAVIDLGGRDILWRWGRGELDRQHHATLQPNGRVLVFDNGRTRKRSRVLEIDPLTNRFAELPTGPRFFTKTRGGVERLPNGNLLVADSNSGRIFEVTPRGETSWEFWNPDFNGRKRASIYRMRRIPMSAWNDLRTALDLRG